MKPRVIVSDCAIGHGAHSDVAAWGSVIVAAASVQAARTNSTPFIVRSRARKRPFQSRSPAPDMTSAPMVVIDQFTPST